MELFFQFMMPAFAAVRTKCVFAVANRTGGISVQFIGQSATNPTFKNLQSPESSLAWVSSLAEIVKLYFLCHPAAFFRINPEIKMKLETSYHKRYFNGSSSFGVEVKNGPAKFRTRSRGILDET